MWSLFTESTEASCLGLHIPNFSSNIFCHMRNCVEYAEHIEELHAQ